jgi:GH15 family glucan-1,4-alpha-glucosidase
VAAATTSLPERAEGGRNYDYRYCWIRDICYVGQAGAAVPGAESLLDGPVRWVTERLLEHGEQTAPAYLPDGRPIPDQSDLDLPGYPGGHDVVGNRVRHQFQLDLFGEALLLLSRAAEHDRLDADGWKAVETAVNAIRTRWEEPEAGVWEVDPAQWTHSRLIAVAGLRAAAGAGADFGFARDALPLADSLLSWSDQAALHPSGRWQRAPDDDRVDASLLLAQVRGALAADDPRSVATRSAVATELSRGGFVYRYCHPGQALGDAEGAFLVCNFWMSLACLGAGQVAESVRWFERARGACGPAGLLAEEFDVDQRQLRGNLPQAFVHALLCETAARQTAEGGYGSF